VRLANAQRIHAAQNLLASLLYGGVFARHPTLTVLLAEMRAGWLPWFVRLLEQQAASSLALGDWPWKESAGEMLRRGVRVTPLPGFGDTDALDVLRAQGIRHVVMLTGDSLRSAQGFAAAVGVDDVRAELLPEDKVTSVEALKAAHGVVAMVGDGVNDAPALATADVGIAMGAAGTDVALETADIALMADELAKIPYAVRLSRATTRNIRANIAFSIALKGAFLVLAVAGTATLWMAVAADMGASLLVIANALRLLRE
jgi:soluble P-type ATPase